MTSGLFVLIPIYSYSRFHIIHRQVVQIFFYIPVFLILVGCSIYLVFSSVYGVGHKLFQHPFSN